MSQESSVPSNVSERGAAPVRIADPNDAVVVPAHPPSEPRWSYKRPFMMAVAAGMIAVAGYWVYDRLNHVNISDARIAADMIALSARVPGWITQLHAQEGDRVSPGQIIASIDHRQAELLRTEAESDVERLRSELERIGAERDMRSAQIDARVRHERAALQASQSLQRANLAELNRATAEWNRAGPLLEKGVIPRDVWERMRNTHQQAHHSVLQSDAEVLAAEAALQETEVGYRELDIFQGRSVTKRHEIKEAQMRLDVLALALADHDVKSPIPGVIDELFVDPGEYVRRGQRILVLHNPDAVWVRANIKETDVRHLKIGTHAAITVDAYPGEQFIGEITRIGNAATSQFALLPNPNPSGNFTKITQRLEVRIDLPQREGRLKPGMMVEVEIDI
jgi:membrane fusion protein (multidrug efflux system)